MVYMSNGNSRFTIHADGRVSSVNITANGLIFVRLRLDDRRLVMNPFTLAHLHKAAQTPKSEYAPTPWHTALHLVSIGFTLINHDLTNEEQWQLQRDLEDLSNTIIDTWSTLDAFLMEYTYIHLRNRLYPKDRPVYEQASEAASFILGEKIAPDAWRMRIKKWAEAQGLPPVVQRLRKPSA